MNLSRRLFLGGSISLLGAALLPQPVIALPTIYGDGVTCDAAGLQALIDGAPFHVANEALTVREGLGITGGVLRLTRSLKVRNNMAFSLSNLTIRIGPSEVNEPILQALTGGKLSVTDTTFFLEEGTHFASGPLLYASSNGGQVTVRSKDITK